MRSSNTLLLVSSVEETVAALRVGEPVLLPTDTVYGLCAAEGEEGVRLLAGLKGREADRPIALLFADIATALSRAPGLERARSLLPGPYTIVVPTARGSTIGVRVPVLTDASRAVVTELGAVLATSANRHGGLDPRRLDDVPPEIRSACGAELDGGELPGVPSTVIDLTGPEPRVLREGAVPAAEALARLR
jgi:L-threonylcarbamoyladenylate synthase